MQRTYLSAHALHIRAWEGNEGIYLLRCSGIVDIENASLLREALDLVPCSTTRRVILDLRDITALDSVGIGHIINARKRLQGKTKLLIWTDDARTRLLLQIAGLESSSVSDGVTVGALG